MHAISFGCTSLQPSQLLAIARGDQQLQAVANNHAAPLSFSLKV
jgi:hypothetical protein